MKLKSFLISICLLIFGINMSAQSLQFKAFGIYNKTLQEQGIDNSVGSSLAGFDPKYGYQLGVSYLQPLFKSFALNGEAGYINKGHIAHNFRSKEVLYEVNYNYYYLKPSVAYQWHGLTLSAGLFFNFLLNEAEAKKLTPGTINKKDIAYSFELSYQYKRFGLSVNTNESLRPMQTITLTGDTYDHYHHWYSLGLSYQIYHKKQNTSNK